jgi:archaellum component FlaF (FlaF/FlaG flagellin family)
VPSSLVIGEAILTIAVILAASMVSAAFLPSFQLLIQGEKIRVNRMLQKSETAVEIVFANAVNGTSQVKVWVKPHQSLKLQTYRLNIKIYVS